MAYIQPPGIPDGRRGRSIVVCSMAKMAPSSMKSYSKCSRVRWNGPRRSFVFTQNPRIAPHRRSIPSQPQLCHTPPSLAPHAPPRQVHPRIASQCRAVQRLTYPPHALPRQPLHRLTRPPLTQPSPGRPCHASQTFVPRQNPCLTSPGHPRPDHAIPCLPRHRQTQPSQTTPGTTYHCLGAPQKPSHPVKSLPCITSPGQARPGHAQPLLTVPQATGRNRTDDHWSTKPALCLLSYSGEYSFQNYQLLETTPCLAEPSRAEPSRT